MQRKQRILLGVISFVLVICTPIALKSENRLALRRMIKEPGRIGMIAPSSRALYKRMIRKALPEELRKGTLIVELGPGTGVGTQLLLERGVPPEQILCVELDPGMQKCMAEKFPAVSTILGCDAFKFVLILSFDLMHSSHSSDKRDESLLDACFNFRLYRVLKVSIIKGLFCINIHIS